MSAHTYDAEPKTALTDLLEAGRREALARFQEEDETLKTLRRAQDGYVEAMREVIMAYKGWTKLKGGGASTEGRVTLEEAPARQIRAVFHRTFPAESLETLTRNTAARRIAYANAAGLRTDYGHARPANAEDNSKTFPITAWLDQLVFAEQQIRAAEDKLGLEDQYVDALRERLAIIAESLDEFTYAHYAPQQQGPNDDSPFHIPF